MAQSVRPPKPYVTNSIEQTYTLDAEGMPKELLYQLVVVAPELVVATEYVFDTPDMRVEGVTGCTASGVRADLYAEEYYAVDLIIDPPLQPGVMTPLAYRVTYPKVALPNELRQGGGARGIPKVGLTVRFAASKPAKRAWAQLFDGHAAGSALLMSQEVPIAVFDSNKPTDGFVAKLEWGNLEPWQVIGLYWEWWAQA